MNATNRALADECAAGGGEVLTVDFAAARAVAISRRLERSERMGLLAAHGRIAAGPMSATIAMPPFDNSAMDGYAVRLSELTGDGPWRLPVVGKLAAGDGASIFPAEGAVRILTGAPLPAGLDAVAMQEHCRLEGDDVMLLRRPRLGENIRRAGEDVAAGAPILSAGDVLTPQRLALLAAQGIGTIDVVGKVRVGLISTGSELRDPGETLGPGQIYNSNRIMIGSTLGSLAWVDTVDLGIAPDRPGELARAFDRARRECDVLVSTGGVSGGDEDHVVAALQSSGGSIDILKVAMRPGKPVKVGLLGEIPFIGLPGNPNAALVTFRQIALPALRRIAGLADVLPRWSVAVAGFGYAKRLGRTEFVPVRTTGQDESGRRIVEMLGRGSSSHLSALADADAIALLPPDREQIERGAILRVERLSDLC